MDSSGTHRLCAVWVSRGARIAAAPVSTQRHPSSSSRIARLNTYVLLRAMVLCFSPEASRLEFVEFTLA